MIFVKPTLHKFHTLFTKEANDTETIFSRLTGPVNNLGLCFVSLWVFDNAVALLRAHSNFFIDSAFCLGFPSAVYTAWLGTVALEAQHAYFKKHTDISPAVRMVVERGLGLLTIVATAATAAYFVGVSPKALFAFGGLAGFATSLAVKDVLTNLFGGVSLLLQKPFTEGDKIKFKGLEAYVHRQGYLQTVLRTSDGALVFYPNGKMLFKILFINSIRRLLGYKDIDPH